MSAIFAFIFIISGSFPTYNLLLYALVCYLKHFIDCLYVETVN